MILSLKNRTVIAVNGEGGKDFLQSIVSNDVFSVTTNSSVFALMLNSKGRFLYDFFIIEKQPQSLLIECELSLLDDIIKRFNLYKINHKVSLEKTHYNVYLDFLEDRNFIENSLDEVRFIDPRDDKLGFRVFSLLEYESADENTMKEYQIMRIKNCIVDPSVDLEREVSFPLEYRMNYAFSFNKGCYIGQEVTARFRLKGETSKKLYVMENTTGLFEKKCDFIINNNDLFIGKVLSSEDNFALVYCNIKNLNESIGDHGFLIDKQGSQYRILNY